MMAFSKSIFINCPFDNSYRRMLHPIIFTCLYCKLVPQLSELSDSGTQRIRNIITIIKNSKYSIHDLSRMKSKKVNELSRFNMPFELGIDIGIRSNATDKLKAKKCLIIDVERYRYQEALSDISGNDIASYRKRNQIENVIKVIRDWFTRTIKPEQPSASKIYMEFTEFLSDLQESLESVDFSSSDIKDLTASEFIYYTGKWIDERKK